MKIHILPVHRDFQPDRQNFRMPTHGLDKGVEQNMLEWLGQQPDLLAENEIDADWSYLPMFWNRLYINWRWGEGGRDRIQSEIERLVSRNRPAFTICEYDIATMQPFYDLCNMVVFTASRRGYEQSGIDIPLLCSSHELPPSMPGKQYLASFAGNLQTDGVRVEMMEAFDGRDDVRIVHGDNGTDFFVNLLLSSHIALAPRGHGGQSFRFYEAMDLGIVPYHIGRPDTRPFKKWIDWDSCSLYAPTVADVHLPKDEMKLKHMGWNAHNVYREQLQYGKWCQYVVKELEEL